MQSYIFFLMAILACTSLLVETKITFILALNLFKYSNRIDLLHNGFLLIGSVCVESAM